MKRVIPIFLLFSLVSCTSRPTGCICAEATSTQDLSPNPPANTSLPSLFSTPPTPVNVLTSSLTTENKAQQQHDQPILLSGVTQKNALATETTNPASPTDAANFMTLMGQNGAVLTVWALAKRNWLWAYSNFYSQNFGTIRNWKMEHTKQREHFRFVNQSLGTCIEAYGNGLIHDTCNLDRLSQAFVLLPTDSGAFVIQSVAQGRCITYNPVSTQDYSTITLSQCDGATTPLRDQTWYLAPPLLDADPIN